MESAELGGADDGGVIARIVGQFIGAAVFFVCLWLIAGALDEGELDWGTIKLVLFVGSIGLAGAHFAITGRFRRDSDDDEIEEEAEEGTYRYFEEEAA